MPYVCLAMLLVVAATFMAQAQPQAAAARCQQAPSPSSPAAAAAAGAGGTSAASPAALAFLRQRCNPGPLIMEEKYAGYCYDSLLPRAASFHGSRLRVVGAAVEVLVANFRSLLAELRRLKGSSGGAAYKLGECIDLAEVMSGEAGGKEEPEKLARIRSLAASGDDRAVNDLLDMDLWLSEDVGDRFDRCKTDVEKIPDVETLLPTMAVMEPAMETCFGLFVGFPQPPEE